MERLEQPTKRKGLNKHHVFLWGMLFLVAGMVSRCILQNRVLQMGASTGMDLLEILSASGSAMAAATAALILQALETCAIPVFAFLLVDEFEKGKSRKKMLLFLLIAAIVSEIPYNYVMQGQFLNLTSRNPIFAMAFGVLVLYFFRRYSEKSAANVLVKVFVVFAAVLWMVMLNVDHGVALLIVTVVMWAFRRKRAISSVFGAVAASACVLISPFYIVSSMGILPVCLYREDDEEEPAETAVVPYLIYPILLVAVGMLANFI